MRRWWGRLFIFAAPHVGITGLGRVGLYQRDYQEEEQKDTTEGHLSTAQKDATEGLSTACGASVKCWGIVKDAIRRARNNDTRALDKINGPYDPDEFQAQVIQQVLVKAALHNGPLARFVDLTEHNNDEQAELVKVMYTYTIEKTEEYIRELVTDPGIQHEVKSIALLGGIMVNVSTDPIGDRFQLLHFTVRDVPPPPTDLKDVIQPPPARSASQSSTSSEQPSSVQHVSELSASNKRGGDDVEQNTKKTQREKTKWDRMSMIGGVSICVFLNTNWTHHVLFFMRTKQQLSFKPSSAVFSFWSQECHCLRSYLVVSPMGRFFLISFFHFIPVVEAN